MMVEQVVGHVSRSLESVIRGSIVLLEVVAAWLCSRKSGTMREEVALRVLGSECTW
jgi:hypothetical protein